MLTQGRASTKQHRKGEKRGIKTLRTAYGCRSKNNNPNRIQSAILSYFSFSILLKLFFTSPFLIPLSVAPVLLLNPPANQARSSRRHGRVVFQPPPRTHMASAREGENKRNNYSTHTHTHTHLRRRHGHAHTATPAAGASHLDASRADALGLQPALVLQMVRPHDTTRWHGFALPDRPAATLSRRPPNGPKPRTEINTAPPAQNDVLFFPRKRERPQAQVPSFFFFFPNVRLSRRRAQ